MMVPNVAGSTIRRLAVVAALLLFGGVRTTAHAQSAAPPSIGSNTSLKPGDVLRISVWRKPELSGDFVIAGDGTVSHPLYREVRVTGVPLSEVETRVREFLTKLETNPQFVIEPLLRVAVAGEVRQPNVYTLRPETSVTQAIAIAGGPTERGRRDRIVVTRDGRELTVLLNRADAAGAAMPIQSGDQIVVEQRSAVFRDLIAPVVGVLGATAAIVSVILYNGHR
jgi:polysaccharide export outer membrane protein